MAKDLSFSTFLDEYDADFFDYLSKTSAACHSDKRYKELTEQIKTLYEQHPNVKAVLDVDLASCPRRIAPLWSRC